MASKEFSFGIIALQRVASSYKVLIIKQISNGDQFWTLTKGHQENNETPLQTATRELMEETGLKASKILLGEQMFSNNYVFKRKEKLVHKHNSYFVGLIEDTSGFKTQESEVADYKWCDLENADLQLTYEEDKKILRQVIEAINKNK